MLEYGTGELAAVSNEGAFHAPSPPNLPSLTLRSIFSGVASEGGALFGQFAKLLGLGCVLALLLPALLIVTVLSLMVARMLGVPLFASPSFMSRHR